MRGCGGWGERCSTPIPGARASRPPVLVATCPFPVAGYRLHYLRPIAPSSGEPAPQKRNRTSCRFWRRRRWGTLSSAKYVSHQNYPSRETIPNPERSVHSIVFLPLALRLEWPLFHPVRTPFFSPSPTRITGLYPCNPPRHSWHRHQFNSLLGHRLPLREKFAASSRPRATFRSTGRSMLCPSTTPPAPIASPPIHWMSASRANCRQIARAVAFWSST